MSINFKTWSWYSEPAHRKCYEWHEIYWSCKLKSSCQKPTMQYSLKYQYQELPKFSVHMVQVFVFPLREINCKCKNFWCKNCKRSVRYSNRTITCVTHVQQYFYTKNISYVTFCSQNRVVESPRLLNYWAILSMCENGSISILWKWFCKHTNELV